MDVKDKKYNEMLHVTGEATAIIPARDNKGKPITVIGTDEIRKTFDEKCIEQALNSKSAPGVTDLVLNPDAHCGYGAPVGCVLVSPTHIYPGPVGVDIKCSMSLLQLNLPAEAVIDKRVRRAIISAILERTPTGAGKGQRSVKKSRGIDIALGKKVVTQGASEEVCAALGIPSSWALKCEDAFHLANDNTSEGLITRLGHLIETGNFPKFADKIQQLGSYGSGNHFGECEIVHIMENEKAKRTADAFGLQDNSVAFLSHCGSRGFGFNLAKAQFKKMLGKFEEWGIPLPGNDRELVYAPLGTSEANDFIDDMALAGNFSTVNQLLINALVLEAFQEVIPGVEGDLVYLISHNFARKEIIEGKESWVHRKGATRAYPAGHFAIKDTIFAETGHPILLPGNPKDGSSVMVAEAGAEKSCFSINHGAGRMLGRKQAKRELVQKEVNSQFDDNDILTNCRNYPVDEAPAAYKDFNEVIRSVEKAGLASSVAKLKAKFVIKDQDKEFNGAA